MSTLAGRLHTEKTKKHVSGNEFPGRETTQRETNWFGRNIEIGWVVKSYIQNAYKCFKTHINTSKTHINAYKTHQNASKTHINESKTHVNESKTHIHASKTHINASNTHINTYKTV